MKNFFIGLIGLIGFIGLITGCAKKEEKKIVVLPPQIPIEKPEMYLPEKYEYKSLNKRDPFIALVVSEKKVTEGGKELLSQINIFELEMTGIVWDKKESMAIFHDGNNFGYILKKGRLLADNFKPIEGIRGEITRNNRVFLQQGKSEVTFFIGKPKITKIQGAQILAQKEVEEREELDKNIEFEEKVNLKKE